MSRRKQKMHHWRNRERTKYRALPSFAKIQDDEANVSPQQSEMASLTKVLEEIRDFSRDTKQLTEIISELTNVDQKIAETRIEKVEDHVQNVEQTLSKMKKAWHWESTSSACPETCWQGRQAPVNNNQIPFFIEVKKRFCTKPRERRGRFFTDKPIYFDQDYLPAILQKRKECSEAKRVFKQTQICYQTPFPAKLRVFYEDGTRLYKSVREATADMKDRGLPVSVITPRLNLAEQLSRTTWETMRGPRQQGTGEESENSIRERLRGLRRQPTSPPEEL